MDLSKLKESNMLNGENSVIDSLKEKGLVPSQPKAGMFVKIEHPHKCTCVAKALAMAEDRLWFIGKLDERLPEYPHETHCLHLKTEYKDVTFLCNEADFRNLMIICRAVIGQPNESWMQSMVNASKVNP